MPSLTLSALARVSPVDSGWSRDKLIIAHTEALNQLEAAIAMALASTIAAGIIIQQQ